MAMPESLGVPRETLAFIILKARAYDGQVDAVGLEDASNPTDDGAIGALEGGDGLQEELRAAIAALNEEEKEALVALTWIGRGDFLPEEWSEARAEARRRKDGPAARYLMGMPLLGDLLEEGAAALGFNVADEEQAGPAFDGPARNDAARDV